MTEVTQDERDAIEMYLALMEEAKSRVNIVNKAYHNEHGFPARMVREICYLQFRFLCEIIALACLVIHGDIKKTRSLREEYKPTKILRQMDGLKNHIYPQPMEVKREDDGVHHRARHDLPHLMKAELGKLWGLSGDFLHRGKMVNLGQGRTIVTGLKPIQSERSTFHDIFEWSEKIVGLLNCHWITLRENKRGILVSLIGVQEAGRAQATIMVLICIQS